MAKRTVEQRNKTESVNTMVRFPPGWIGPINQLADLLGNSQAFAIKEAIRRVVKQELGIDLQHRAPGQREFEPAEEAPTPKPRKKR